VKQEYIEELYLLIKSELKKSDLDDIHELAYSITRREFSTQKKITTNFLDYYLTNILDVFDTYNEKKMESINGIIKDSVYIENRKPFDGIYLDLNNSEEGIISSIETIKLSETLNFEELENSMKNLLRDLRKNFEKGEGI
jgi:hypothetical protein